MATDCQGADGSQALIRLNILARSAAKEAMKIAFYTNPTKERSGQAAAELAALARSLSLETCALEEAEVVVALGGDGTVWFTLVRPPFGTTVIVR